MMNNTQKKNDRQQHKVQLKKITSAWPENKTITDTQRDYCRECSDLNEILQALCDEPRPTKIHGLADVPGLLDIDKFAHLTIWQHVLESQSDVCIDTLLDGRYTFKPYWDLRLNLISKQEWINELVFDNKVSLTAIENNDSYFIFRRLIERMNTLAGSMKLCPEVEQPSIDYRARKLIPLVICTKNLLAKANTFKGRRSQIISTEKLQLSCSQNWPYSTL